MANITDNPKVWEAMNFFQRNGWTPEQAAGIVGNLFYESRGLNERQTGDNNQAYGLGQWHPDRQQQFQSWAGKPIQDSSFQDQLGFVQHELTEGEDAGARRAGKLLPNAENPSDAAVTFMQQFERTLDRAPAGPDAVNRMTMAEDIYNAAPPSDQAPAQSAQVSPRPPTPPLSPQIYSLPQVST